MSSIVHNGSVVVWNIKSFPGKLFEVLFHTWDDVILNNFDKTISIKPRMFVLKAKSVKDLMSNVAYTARWCNEHRLLASDEAHV